MWAKSHVKNKMEAISDVNDKVRAKSDIKEEVNGKSNVIKSERFLVLYFLSDSSHKIKHFF